MDLLKRILNFNDLPEEWSVEKLGDYFDFYNGLSLSRNLLNDSSETLCLHYGDIHVNGSLTSFNTTRDRKWLPRIDMEINDARNGVSLENGDLVFADASEDYEGIGKSIVVVNEDESDFIAGLHTIVAKDKTSKLDIDYKKYFLQPTFVRKQFRRIAAGSSVFGVNKSEIANISFLLPSINEQKKIGIILENVDINILNISKKIKYLTELKKALAKKLLTEGIGHNEFKNSEVGRIPVDWEVSKLGNLYPNMQSGATPRRNIPEYYQGDIPWLSSGELNYNIVADTNEHITGQAVKDTNLKIYPVGTVFIAITGLEAAGTRGSCAINGIELTTNQSCMAFIENPRVDNYFLFYWYVVNGERLAYRYAQGTKQQSFNISILSDIDITIPTLTEQKKIVKFLVELDKLITQYTEQKFDYTHLKEGLMHQLLTGRIRVKSDDI